MRTPARCLPLLFVCAIVVPTLVLAYLGLREVRDDGQRVAAEQQRVASLARQRFDAVVERALEALQRTGEATRPSPDPALRHVFALDHQGAWQVPRFSSGSATRLSSRVAAAVAAARQAEFAAGDCGAALSCYREIAAGCRGAERAVVLGEAARCAARRGDVEQSLRLYGEIAGRHPQARGEAGEHLVTLAWLRMAELHLQRGQHAAGLADLDTWRRAVEHGDCPVHAGSHYLVRHEGRPVSRGELLDQVWRYDELPTTRTVDNHVASLRAKLEPDASHPAHLL
ncbi:MAG: winged helix-turn-helix domain-containing protein, partial [Candidatus Latescibacterota bacterium]